MPCNSRLTKVNSDMTKVIFTCYLDLKDCRTETGKESKGNKSAYYMG